MKLHNYAVEPSQYMSTHDIDISVDVDVAVLIADALEVLTPDDIVAAVVAQKLAQDLRTQIEEFVNVR